MVVNLKNNNKHIKYYNIVSEDIKFISNSLIRLKVLSALYDKPKDMKELTNLTKLKYSSISNALHSLELKDMIHRKSNKYYMDMSIKLKIKNIIQLAIIINLLDEIFSIITNHNVYKLPKESIMELSLLENVELIESNYQNIDKVIKFIEKTLTEAKNVRAILPVYYKEFDDILNNLVDEGKYVEIKVSRNILRLYKKRSKIKYMSSFKGRNNFLLIITHEIMILGFFKEGNGFDKNRILTSADKDALKWANNLFRYFKKLNK